MTETNHNPRRPLVEAALRRHPEAVVQNTLRLWAQLAPELISIIGEGGFMPLYARSLRLACKQYPWLAQEGKAPSGNELFTPLKERLQAQDIAQAHEASLALFNIFLDLMASLIGEELTIRILHSAWSRETSETPAKDFPK
jgi:hypothetical protein